MPFFPTFEDGKKYGFFYINGAATLLGTVMTIGPVFASWPITWVMAIKMGLLPSNYLAGGALVAYTYLSYKAMAFLGNTCDKIFAKINQKLIHKNEKLKNLIVDDKKTFKEAIP